MPNTTSTAWPTTAPVAGLPIDPYSPAALAQRFAENEGLDAMQEFASLTGAPVVLHRYPLPLSGSAQAVDWLCAGCGRRGSDQNQYRAPWSWANRHAARDDANDHASTCRYGHEHSMPPVVDRRELDYLHVVKELSTVSGYELLLYHLITGPDFNRIDWICLGCGERGFGWDRCELIRMHVATHVSYCTGPYMQPQSLYP